MKAVTIIDRFAVFGNFAKIVTDEIPTLVKIFDGYNMTQRQESTPQGPVTITIFQKENCAISLRTNRMDIECANNPKVEQNPISIAVAEFKKVKDSFNDLVANRVSFIGTYFIPNPNNEPLEDMVENLGLSQAFGKSNEFNFRLNSPVVICNETCNAVLTVQQGAVQNQQKQNLPAIICVNDINTLAKDTTNRFELDQLEEMFTQMVNKSLEKNEKVLALIENAAITS